MTRTAQDRTIDRDLVAWAQGSGTPRADRRAAWARDRLVKRHSGLVYTVVRRTAYPSLLHDREDLMQWGFIGLLKGVAKFDLSHDVAFATYVMHWIRAEVARRSLPVKPHEMRVLSAARRLRASGDLSEAEVAERLGVKPARLRRVDQAAATPMSLDAKVVDAENAPTLGDALPDPGAVHAEIALEGASDAAAVRRAMARLPDREREVVELRFGFRDADGDGLTHDGVAARLKPAFGKRDRGRVTRQRVQQIEAKAFEKLRRYVEEERT